MHNSSYIIPWIALWIALIAGYAREGKGQQALECFVQMQRKGVLPNAVCWNDLIAGYAQNGHIFQCDSRICGTMERSVHVFSDGGHVPEELMMNAMLDGCVGDFSSFHYSSSVQSFTSLSQADADLALARALQQQEHAYLLLQIGNEGSDYDASDSGNFTYDYFEEDLEEVAQPSLDLAFLQGSHLANGNAEEQEEINGSHFEDDEALARALQEAEHHEATAYMISLIGIEESHGDDDNESRESQESWQDVDPDNMSYEELIALGAAVGTHSKGLARNVIAALPHSTFSHSHTTAEDPCVICRFDYEDGAVLLTLPCKHCYHADCIKNWLEINKVCPICSAEVTS